MIVESTGRDYPLHGGGEAQGVVIGIVRGDDERPIVDQCFDEPCQQPVRWSCQRHVDELQVVGGRGLQRLCERERVADSLVLIIPVIAGGVTAQFHIGRESHDADSIARFRSDDARDRRAMSEIIGIQRFGDEDLLVLHAVFQIRVIDVDGRIDDADPDILAG